LKFQAKEEVANRILLEASLNRGFPSKSENIRLSEIIRLSEPPFQERMFSDLEGKPQFKEASNKIRFVTSSLPWNFNKRLNPISLDRFIYPIFLYYLRSLVDKISFVFFI
jgi:hypothetical protein